MFSQWVYLLLLCELLEHAAHLGLVHKPNTLGVEVSERLGGPHKSTEARTHTEREDRHTSCMCVIEEKEKVWEDVGHQRLEPRPNGGL